MANPAAAAPLVLMTQIGTAALDVPLRELMDQLIAALPPVGGVARRIDRERLAKAYLDAHRISANPGAGVYLPTQGRSRMVPQEKARKWLTIQIASLAYDVQPGQQPTLSGYQKLKQQVAQAHAAIQQQLQALNAQTQLAQQLLDDAEQLQEFAEETQEERDRVLREFADLHAQLSNFATAFATELCAPGTPITKIQKITNLATSPMAPHAVRDAITAHGDGKAAPADAAAAAAADVAVQVPAAAGNAAQPTPGAVGAVGGAAPGAGPAPAAGIKKENK